MVDYSPYLQILLEQQNFDEDTPETYYLTVYQPNNGFDKAEIKLRIKSKILEGLRQNDKTKNAKKIKQKILNPVFNLIDELDSLKRGIAVFVKFTLERGHKLTVIKPSTVAPLIATPEAEITLGKAYDMDQLINIAYADIDALVVNLHRQEFEIYQFHDLQLSKTYADKNWYIREKPKHYLEKYGPTGKGDGIFHTTGTDKLDKTIQKENETFMNWLREYLLKERDVNYKHLIVYYSDYFQDIIDGLRQPLVDRLGDEKVEMINKTMVRREDLKKMTVDTWEELKEERVKQQVKEIEDKYYGFKKDWDEVTEAVRQGQVKTLYLKPDLKRPGFLLEDNLLYTWPMEDTQKVENLAPWLVKAVEDQNGRVIVLDQDEFEDYPEVMAELRYKIDQSKSKTEQTKE